MVLSRNFKIGLGVAIPFLLGAAASTPDGASLYTQLTLSGVGYESQPTEYLQISASTNNFEVRPSEAMSQNARTMDRLRQKLKQLRIDEQDFQTSNFQFQKGTDPEDRDGSPRKGYNVAHSLSVIIRDPKQAGPIMDELVAVGADNLSVRSGYGYQTDISPEKLKLARGRAIKDAQEKANDYAKALGLKIRRIVEIRDGSGHITGGPMPMARAVNVEAATQIDSRAATIQASVQVVFELG